MSEVVSVEVASAIVVDGQVVLPGQVVEVPPGDARMLVAQGKAKLPEDVEKSDNGDAKDDAQVGAPVGGAKARRARD